MKGAVISIIILLLLSAPVFSADRIVDNADRLKGVYLADYRDGIERISVNNDFDLVVLFEKNISDTDPVSHAKAFFASNNYGLGHEKSGCLLLITDNNDFWFCGSGRGARLIDEYSYSINNMKDQIEKVLGNNYPGRAIRDFYEGWKDILDRATLYFPPGIRVVDKFGFLEDRQLEKLNALSEKVSSAHKFDIVIAIDSVARGGRLKDIAADVFFDSGFGYGKDRDGAIFYMVQARGRSKVYDHNAFGRGKGILNSAAAAKLESDLERNIDLNYANNYEGACQSFIENWDIFLAIDERGKEYSPDTASLGIARGRLTDNADLLTDTDKESLEKILDEISSTYNFDLVIAGEKNTGDKKRWDYAHDFFDYNDFGIGEDRDGCLFLQVTENRTFWFSTSGRGRRLMNNLAYEELVDKVAPLLRDRRSYSAYLAFITTWEKFLALEAEGKSYNFFRHYSSQFKLAAICLAILIITYIMRRQIDQFIYRLRNR